MSELVTDSPKADTPLNCKQWIAVLLCLSVAFSLFCSRFGPFHDDYIILRWLRTISWRDIVTLDAGPFPVLLGLWKAAVRYFPESPQTPLLALSGLVHGFNCYLAYLAFRRFFPDRTALLAAAIWAVYRPGNQAIIWAGAVHDPIMTAFALLTFILWANGGHQRWWSCATFAIAMLAKTSVILLPAVLLLYTALFEAPEETRRIAVRRVTPAFLAMLLIATLIFLNSILRPGYWDQAFFREARTIATVSRYGEGFARAFLLVTYRGLADIVWPGYLLLAVAITSCIAIRDHTLRFGCVWTALTLLPTIVASNLVGPRYFYLASPGAVIAIVRAYELLSAKLVRPDLAKGALALWLLANISLYGVDIVSQLSWNRLYKETETVFEENRTELTRAERFSVVNCPYALWLQFIAEYVADERIHVVYSNTCDIRTMPCLIFERELESSALAQIVPDTGHRFVRWVSLENSP